MNITKRKPTTPGEIVNEEFLKPLGWTQGKLANHLDCDIKVVNRIINGRTAVTAEMALKLAATFGTSPEFWLNAQTSVDLYHASRNVRKLPKPIPVSLYSSEEDEEEDVRVKKGAGNTKGMAASSRES